MEISIPISNLIWMDTLEKAELTTSIRHIDVTNSEDKDVVVRKTRGRRITQAIAERFKFYENAIIQAMNKKDQRCNSAWK